MSKSDAYQWAKLEVACDAVTEALNSLEVESPISDGAEAALLKMYKRLSEAYASDLVPGADI